MKNHKCLLQVGDCFNELCVIDTNQPTHKGHRQVLVCCSCGQKKVVRISSLLGSKVKSCGHKLREQAAKSCRARATHMMAVKGHEAPEYTAWLNMKSRCSNPHADSYQYYGARGIKVCPEWEHSFEAFIAYVGPKTSSIHSIDRINVDGNYEPGNVRWATPSQQSSNRRPWKRKMKETEAGEQLLAA